MITYHPIETETVRAYQRGGPDAYGNTPERAISTGEGTPCRHCLKYIPKGEPYLILAHRPFPETQAYAETGPVFLCAKECEAPKDVNERPEIMTQTDELIVRGYDVDNRIIYDACRTAPCDDAAATAKALFDEHNAAYVHVRYATTNCFRLRIEPA